MSEVVTVAIPVLNGARYLDEVLSAVRSQRVDREVELLVFDSGSTDGSLEIARRHEARLVEIPKAEYSHGGTRNRMVATARGSHVAFLTQDATPAHDGWLAAMLDGFEAAADVAAVFGPHDARPGASHVIAGEMERHFANWGGGTQVDVQRLDRTPEGLAAYRANPGLLTFFSDVNGCIARWAWQRIPYRDVPYAEDQLLGRDLVEAGYAKVFHPGARVLHSHDYGAIAFFRRYFDEYRGLREVLGHREPAGPRHMVRALRGLVSADRAYLRAHGRQGIGLVLPLAYSTRHHTLRLAGAALGSRARRVPAPLRRRFSLEGRDSFAPVAGATLQGDPALDRRPVHVTPSWPWDFVRRGGSRHPIVYDAPAPWRTGPLTIAWVVPPWSVGSGGHTAIFQLIAQLERLGHRCAIHVFNPLGWPTRPAHELREQIRAHFVGLEARVFLGLDDFRPADVCVATNWWTAYPVRDLPGCREKVYLVQDHEPDFFPRSSQAIWAEETYRMGFRCVSYTPWLVDLLRTRYGLDARYVDCGIDTETYAFAEYEGRDRGLVAVYGRGETERRGVELAIAGLAALVERRPDLRVALFGSNLPAAAPFPCVDLGVVTPAELAALYRRASAGVVFSLTNLSLVTMEMLACGLPIVEVDAPNVSQSLGASGEHAMLAAPFPEDVARAIEAILDEPAAAAAMARRAHALVGNRSWRRSGEQLEAVLLDFLGSPGPGR